MSVGQQGVAVQGWVHGRVSRGRSSGKVFTGVARFGTEIPQAVQCHTHTHTHTHAHTRAHTHTHTHTHSLSLKT